MTHKFTHTTTGTCSRTIEIELEGTTIKEVRFEGGCHGNTQGVALLVQGMSASAAAEKLAGIDCKGRGTSCPDQLAQALRQMLAE